MACAHVCRRRGARGGTPGCVSTRHPSQHPASVCACRLLPAAVDSYPYRVTNGMARTAAALISAYPRPSIAIDVVVAVVVVIVIIIIAETLVEMDKMGRRCCYTIILPKYGTTRASDL